MNLKRTLAACLSAALLLGLLPASAAEDPSRIELKTAEQLCDFSHKCTLDTWSQGKTVILAADIDLSGVDFDPIPTFGGTFEGGGHIISGLSMTQDGSRQGLFRTVQESASVRDLRVSGQITPGGSASMAGGIAGQNFGTLQNCTFTGTAAGKNNIGGIAGVNEGTGQLISCKVTGIISGEHYTGGITGQNLGSAVSCENRAQVNTREESVSVTLADLNWEQVNSTENVRAHTDSGGIAGFSSGILQSCTNYGTIGYPHTGYNVGGIVGRQSGQLDGCVNTGTVRGRKDVGGIAGQLEPFLLLQFSEDSLQKLDGELDTLRSLLRQLGDEASLTGDLVNVRADALTEQLEQVRTGAHDISGWTNDFLNGTVDTVNELSARTTRTFDRLEPVFGDLSNSGAGLGDAFRQVSDLFDNMDQSTVWGKEAAADGRAAFDRMGDAMDSLRTALRDVHEALLALRSSPGDRDAMDAAIEQMSQAIEALKQALGNAGAAPAELAGILDRLGDAGAIIPGDLPAKLKALGDAFRQAADAVGALWDGLSGLLHGNEGPGLRDRLRQSLSHLRDGTLSGADALEALRRASFDVNGAFDNLEILSDELDGTLSGMTNAFTILGTAMDAAKKAADGLESLSEELASDSILEIPALNSEYTSTADRIFDALDIISNETTGLRTDLRGSGDRLHNTAEAVNDQLGVISGLLMDGYDDILDRDEEKERIEDVSDKDDGGSQGRVSHAVNRGTVEGDVDVGGIAGAMAVEYDLDPEDDISSAGRRSANFSYQTRAVMTGCRNEGEITAKKNHAGGIVGRMDLGRVSSCESYGPVASTDGTYVGGIAGASYAAIRDSWVKCALTGEDYVGGVAGFAHDLSGCRVLAPLTASGECVGAVAGDADGVLSGNLFVDDVLGAIDGVSYAGKAEPASYDTLLAAENLPDAFRRFTVTFLVDGTVLEEASVSFGESLETIPELPARDGQFGEWSDNDFSNLRANKTVEAVYTPFITVLESAEERDGKPLLLAEGEFDRSSSLVMGPATSAPDSAPGEAFQAKAAHCPNSSRSGHILRALAAEGDNTVWLAKEGRWYKTDSVRDGSYLVFSIDGDEAIFCLSSQANYPLVLLLAAGIAVLALAAIIRRRRKKHRTAPHQDRAPECVR